MHFKLTGLSTDAYSRVGYLASLYAHQSHSSRVVKSAAGWALLWDQACVVVRMHI